MPEQDTAASHSWLADEWAAQLTHVMESMTGEAPSVAYAPHELSATEIDPNQNELIGGSSASAAVPMRSPGSALQPRAGRRSETGY